LTFDFNYKDSEKICIRTSIVDQDLDPHCLQIQSIRIRIVVNPDPQTWFENPDAFTLKRYCNCIQTLMSCFPSFLDSPLGNFWYLLFLLLNHGNFTKHILTKRILTIRILTKRILTERILTQCILTLNVYYTKTYTNIPGFSLSLCFFLFIVYTTGVRYLIL
jgi:hypothetical protein